MITVKKRDGSVVEFDHRKIYLAIYRCVLAAGLDTSIVQDLATTAVMDVTGLGSSVDVEQIQDIVVKTLREQHGDELADSYSGYRAGHAVDRAGEAYGNDPFRNPLQRWQFYDKYSRWNKAARRRESWPETVSRAVSYLRELSKNKLTDVEYGEIYEAVYNLDVMPSMRLLAMAGKAARVQPLSIYNCSYLPIDSLDAFHEVLLISMSGCGVGYSVESAYTEKLPVIARALPVPAGHFIVNDSTEGWVRALEYGVHLWYDGLDVQFDYSRIRPKGAVLHTKGGRASGPEPLRKLLDFTRSKIRAAAGRKLTPLECHDIVTMIGSVVVQGGVRRTAMISLFDETDREMMTCKDPENIKGNEQRWFANNSAVWTKRKSFDEVLAHMTKIAEYGTGEPGIFSRRAANWTAPRRRGQADYGTNPCAEIALRPMQLCNLSVAVARPTDTIQSLVDKVRIATTIGTIQSMATDFEGLRPQWRENAVRERLLGVDIIGQMDTELVRSTGVLSALRAVARNKNIEMAIRLGINPSAAITCVKPGGNSSVLLDASPGIHARHAQYYIRRVRVSGDGPLYNVLRHSHFPLTPENGQTEENATTWVAAFPVRSPAGAIVKKDLSALEQLEYWLKVKKEYTEHNPSATITFRQSEVRHIAKFIYYNQEFIGGLSFLPADESEVAYEQLPYEEIDEQTYNRMMAEIPDINYAWLPVYETSDRTTVAKELACVSGLCDV